MKDKGIHVIDFHKTTHDSIDPDLKQVDLAIAIGGDGTAIKTFRTIPPGIPVLCINAGGTRGILSEVSKSSVSDIISPLLNGDYFLDKRLRLFAQIGEETLSPVLNDYVIIRSDLTKTPLFSLSVNDHEISQKMDGIIISTPTGSTGHSLSSHGPILYENLDCIMVTTIASVNRLPAFVMPIVDLFIYANYDVQIIMDGQQIREVPKNTKIKITRFEYDAIFLRFHKNLLRQMNKLGY